MTTSSTRLALLNGRETTAKKVGGVWFAGGDKVTAGDIVSVAAKAFLSGEWAWHKLKGSRLIFEDNMTAEEVRKQIQLEKQDMARQQRLVAMKP